MKRRLSGSFRIDASKSGFRRVRNTRSPHEVAWLRNARTLERGAPQEQPLPESFDLLRLTWDAPNVVTVVLGDGDTALILTADSVQLQEPDERLYDSLPLARFTPAAWRFWQRIFWLVRLPGGRSLLRLVARRRRA